MDPDRRSDESFRLDADLVGGQRLKAVRDMAAGIAHELHQPLSVIANYANGCLRRLERGTLREEDLADVLRSIVAEATRAGGIIARVRDFLSTRDPGRQPTDLNQVVRDAIHLAGDAIRRRDAAVELDLSDPLPPVEANRIELTQAVLGLVLNALDPLRDREPAARRVRIETRRAPSGEVEIAVVGVGDGIGHERQPKGSDPLSTAAEPGLELGLAISRTIAEDHGGSLHIAARPGGCGEFTLTLPAQDPAHVVPGGADA